MRFAGNNLALHINETTVSFPFEATKVQEVTSALNDLLQTFKDKQAAERPKRWKPMEYRHKGRLPASSLFSQTAEGALEVSRHLCAEHGIV